MATAERVWQLAAAVMDELSPSGAAVNGDNADLRARAVGLLNVLLREGAARCGCACAPVDALTDTIENLPDDYAEGCLPYGLAAALLCEERPAAAEYFRGEYERLSRFFTRGVSEQTEDIYGGLSAAG